MTKFILFSHPRHGSSYFTSNFKNINNNTQALMDYEPLRPVKICKNLFANSPLNGPLDVIALYKMRYKDEKQYFYTIFKILQERAKIHGANTAGFKIFLKHLSHSFYQNHITLRESIAYADKIIILDRNNLEYIFSLVNAWKIKKWSREKAYEVILNEKETQNIINDLKNKYNFFYNVQMAAAELKKEYLYLHYDQLGSAKNIINKFLNIELQTWLPFEKYIYDYKHFLNINPYLAEFINDNPKYFV